MEGALPWEPFDLNTSGVGGGVLVFAARHHIPFKEGVRRPPRRGSVLPPVPTIYHSAARVQAASHAVCRLDGYLDAIHRHVHTHRVVCFECQRAHGRGVYWMELRATWRGVPRGESRHRPGQHPWPMATATACVKAPDKGMREAGTSTTGNCAVGSI